MSEIVLKSNSVTKDYIGPLGNKVHLLEEMSFEVELNKTTALLAPAGSGKSSLLRICAGLETQFSGEIKKLRDGKTAFIPSKPSSFPWLSTVENVKFAADDLSEEKLAEIIELIGLEGYEDHFPNNKSLGYRFRLALGRALAVDPSLIIIDEPFNKIDSVTKQEIYDLINKINSIIDVTFLLGTTNISEALYLSDQLIIMGKNPGRILKKLNVEFPSGRTSKLFESAEFRDMRASVEEILRENHSQLFNLSI